MEFLSENEKKKKIFTKEKVNLKKKKYLKSLNNTLQKPI